MRAPKVMTKPFDCPRESDVTDAVFTRRWPNRVDAELRDHVSTCGVCRDLVAVVSIFEEECDQSRETARVPDAASVWWRAQVRAREDAARVAGRPITMAQVIAIAATFAAAGAIFGATSGWFQRGLGWIGNVFSSVLAWRLPLPPTDALTSIVASHGLLVIGFLLCVLLAPVAVYLAVRED
jgi:hypothetical protein